MSSRRCGPIQDATSLLSTAVPQTYMALLHPGYYFPAIVHNSFVRTSQNFMMRNDFGESNAIEHSGKSGEYTYMNQQKKQVYSTKRDKTQGLHESSGHETKHVSGGQDTQRRVTAAAVSNASAPATLWTSLVTATALQGLGIQTERRSVREREEYTRAKVLNGSRAGVERHSVRTRADPPKTVGSSAFFRVILQRCQDWSVRLSVCLSSHKKTKCLLFS
jgi:hypothetical protein